MNVDKLAEKNVSTVFMEQKMIIYKKFIQEMEDLPRERNAFFI